MDSTLSLLLSDGPLPGGLVTLLVKATLLCLLGVSIGSELSSMPAMVRHRIALGTVSCLAALPLLGMALATWELPILPRDAADGISQSWLFANVLVAIYLVVALVLFARLCVDILRTALLSGRARPAGPAFQLWPELALPRRDTPVKFSREIRSPLTWGWLRPRVLLPRDAMDWKPEDLSMALQHELAHIDRADWVGHLLARCVHALYWPVPGIRQLMRQLSLSAEQACDDRVLATGVDAPRYAAMLLRQARGNRVPATVSLGHGTELGTRIRYMVEEIVDHNVFATGSAATFTACLLLTLPVATAQLGQRPELPVLSWGSGAPTEETASPTVHTMDIDAAVLRALRPGPERPDPPPVVEKPPRFDLLEKPTVPPPRGTLLVE